MKTTQEVVAWVESAIGTVLGDALAESNKQEDTPENRAATLTLIGAIGGALIKAGIATMAQAGIPKELLQPAVNFAVEEVYRE